MNSKPWLHSVKFETGIGQFRIILTTGGAARYLLNGWPIDEGAKLNSYFVPSRPNCRALATHLHRLNAMAQWKAVAGGVP